MITYRLLKPAMIDPRLPSVPAGSIVLSPSGPTYGIAEIDSRLTGVERIAVSLGDAAYFTVPKIDLEEISP